MYVVLPTRRRAPLRAEALEDRVVPATGDLLQTLANPNPTAVGDQFGTAVAMDAQYIVVGNPLDDVGGFTDAGSVSIFNRATGQLIRTIPNPEPGTGDQYGFSVVIFGGDGWIGAPFDDPGGGVDSGSLYSFSQSGGIIEGFRFDNPSPATGDQFGYSLARDSRGIFLAIGAPGDDAGATDSGRAYVTTFTAGAVSGSGIVSNPNAAVGDRFGESVAVDVFGNLLVGAPFDDVGALADAGRVFLYNSDLQGFLATFENPAAAADDRFGASVAISGNSQLGLIGTPGDDPNNVTDAGTAYVFDVNAFGGTLGALVATLNNPNPAVGDNFGASVAADGLVALVGATGDDVGASNDAGTVYEFRATTGQLLATLNNPTPATDDRFGAVALFQDRGVVGVAADDPGGVVNVGSAYVFDTNNPPVVTDDTVVVPRDAGPTAVVARGTDSGLPDLGEFLSVTAVTQGANGGTVAIADSGLTVTYAPPAGFVGTDSFTYTLSDGRGATATGTVNVIVSAPPGSGPVATLGPANPDGQFANDFASVAANDTWVVVRPNQGDPIGVYDAATGALVRTLPNPAFAFASAIAVSGNRALVGSDQLREAYLYDLTTGNLLRTFQPPSAVTLFGISVALDGDTVAIGSFEDHISFANPNPATPGRVFIYNANTGSLVRTISNPTFDFQEEGFGTGVAVSGNALVVGAFQGNVAANVALGQAYIYDLATGQLQHTLNSAARHFNQLFGASVAISDGRVVVGAREQAYLFDAATGALLTTFADPTPTVTDNFGLSVALAGNRVLVGAPGDDPNALADAGAAYLFDAATGTYLRSFVSPVPAAGEAFGGSVALTAQRAAVGTLKGNPAAGAGAAYLFDPILPPTLRDDTLTVAEDAAATVVNVLTNDFTVPGAGALSVTSVTQPTNGLVTLSGGVVRYTPNPNFFGSDSFTYTATDALGGTSTASVDVTVTDVAEPVVSIADVTAAEGTGGTTTFTFNLSLSFASSVPVTVRVNTADDSATAPGDYQSVVNGTAMFAPGATTATVAVQVAGDNTVEPDETFFVSLDQPTGGATISDGQATGTIQNDDAVLVSVVASDPAASETGSNGGQFLLTRTGDLTAPLTVNFLVGGTATAGADYKPLPRAVTFAPGSATATVDVAVRNDSRVEGPETVTLTPSAGAGYTVASGGATVTIADNEAPPRRVVPLGGLVAVFEGGSSDPSMVLSALPGLTAAAAAGDVDGDGVADVAVTIASGGPGMVLIYDGATGAVRNTFFAFPLALGYSIALGDTDDDGRAEVVLSTASLLPFVGVFDATTGALRSSFLAGPPTGTGVSVGAGDLDGDGRAEIVTGLNLPGITAVLVFNADQSMRTALVLPLAAGGVLPPPLSVFDGDVDGRGDIRLTFGGFVLVLDGRTLGFLGVGA